MNTDMNQFHRFAKHLRTGALVTGILVLLTTGTLVASGGRARAARFTSAPSASASTPAPQDHFLRETHTDSYANDPPDSAGHPCSTASRLSKGIDEFSLEVWWFKMTTKFCFNPDLEGTVVYHLTTLSGGVTNPGTGAGWYSGGSSPIHFNCYIAFGNSSPCSGNHEDAYWAFQDVLIGVGVVQTCFDTISENENFVGQFFASSSVQCV